MCYRFTGEDIPAEEAQYGSFDVGKILYWTPWHSFVIVYAESDEEIDDLVNADESERYRKGMKQFRKNVFRTASGIALLDSIFREELRDTV